MKRMLSVIVSVTVVTALLLGVFPLSVSAESLYIRKIVSVVYDDSGSMLSSANWAYANYAMQAFCGLMNSEDRLFITYMSEAERDPYMEPTQIDLSSGSIQQSVDDIRAHKEGSNTPIAAIEIAFNKLLATPDPEPNTEYWLVILTDGEFQDSYGYGVYSSDLDNRMRSITSAQMPNGSRAQVTYLAIGKHASKPTEDTKNGIYVYESAGAKDIVSVMSTIANRVSGRALLDRKEIKKKSADSIEIKSSVPLLNIAILSQKSDVKIADISYTDGGSLNVERSVSIRYPDWSGYQTDKSLLGGTFLINNGSRNINAGSYTLRFTGAVNPKDLVIMFEPALEIRMSVVLNGTEVELPAGLEALHEGDLVDVVCRLYEIGTGNEVPVSQLPSDTEYRITVEENSSVVAENKDSDLLLKDVELHNLPTEISAIVEIKGSNAIRLSTGRFTPDKPAVYSIGIDKPDDFSMSIDELKANRQSIRFTIYENGLPLTAEQAEKMAFTVETEMPGKVVREADGVISFTPLYRDPVTTIPMGTVEVTGTLSSIASVTTSLYIKPIKYEIKAIGADTDIISRLTLSGNRNGVRFKLYADGAQLGRSDADAADIEIRLNSPYGKRLVYLKEVDANGLIRVIPQYDRWAWLIPYFIPVGDITITAAFQGSEDCGSIGLMWTWQEIVFNIIIPLICLAVLIGHIFKKRFIYTKEIAYHNTAHASAARVRITGSAGDWDSKKLFCLMAFVPFLADSKEINGIRFYADGWMGSRRIIRIKCKKLDPASGMVTKKLSIMDKVDFKKSDVTSFNKVGWKSLSPGNSFVVSGDPNYAACQVFYYVN